MGKLGKITRNCLVCGYGGKTVESKDDYQEVGVCPKCNGAFVDIWCINKYTKNDWKPNKNVQESNFLTIELQDKTSVPKVFYKGEEITSKVKVQFDWETRTESVGGCKIHIEHYEDGKEGGAKEISSRTIVHKTGKYLLGGE